MLHVQHMPRWDYYRLKQFFIDGNWRNMYTAQFSHSRSYLCLPFSATSRRPICHKRAGTSMSNYCQLQLGPETRRDMRELCLHLLRFLLKGASS